MSAEPDTNAKPMSTDQAPAATEVKPSARQRARPATTGDGIRLSERAGQQVKAILGQQRHPESRYLYVGVKGGGCSGLQYVLDLRDEAHAPVNENDEVFESQGLVVVCDLKSYTVGNLTGTEIDYKDDSLMGQGFTFNNPNAKQRCGCGASYSA